MPEVTDTIDRYLSLLALQLSIDPFTGHTSCFVCSLSLVQSLYLYSRVGSEAKCTYSLVSRASNMAKKNNSSTKPSIISSRVCPTYRAIFARKNSYSTHMRNGSHYCVPPIVAPLQLYVAPIPVVASPAVGVLNSEMSMFDNAFPDQEYDGEDSSGGGGGDVGVEDYVTSAAPSPAPNETTHLGVPMPPHMVVSWLKYDDHGLLPVEDINFLRSNDNLADNDQENFSSESSNTSDEENWDHFIFGPLPIPGGVLEKTCGDIDCNHMYQASKSSTLEDGALRPAQEKIMFHIKENGDPLTCTMLYTIGLMNLLKKDTILFLLCPRKS
jgi:hypothetical protein